MHTSLKVVLMSITAATPICVDASIRAVFSSELELRENPPINFTLKKPCDAEELQTTAPLPELLLFSAFRWIAQYLGFFNSRQLRVFAFISSIMFTIPIRTFCNLV